MMCAAVAAQSGRRVVLIDHAERLAEKIRISGGGRCNFTNINAQPANFLSANPHFCCSALARYTPRDFLALLKQYRVKWHEKHKGQLFCDDSSDTIIDVLKSECDAGGVVWRRPVAVHEIRHHGARFSLDTTAGAMGAAALIIATGGLSIPKIGVTDFGYRVAKQFGHKLVDTRPALVPLTFTFADWAPFAALSGLSLPVRINQYGERARPAANSTKTCCSRIAACRGRACCRSRASGIRRSRSTSICCPMSTPPKCCSTQKRGRKSRSAISCRSTCSRGLHIHVAGSAAGFCRCAPRRSSRPHAARDRRVAVGLGAHAERHRGLSQGGSHARGRRYARTLLGDDDEPARRGPLFHRRGSRRHRLARRLQLPVGVGVGRRGGQGGSGVRAGRGDGRLSAPARGLGGSRNAYPFAILEQSSEDSLRSGWRQDGYRGKSRRSSERSAKSPA